MAEAAPLTGSLLRWAEEGREVGTERSLVIRGPSSLHHTSGQGQQGPLVHFLRSSEARSAFLAPCAADTRAGSLMVVGGSSVDNSMFSSVLGLSP